MEAYDWLARIDNESGDSLTAQKTLEQVIRLSPKSIRRQQLLADLAVENDDHATARKAFNAAVDLGEHSCYSRIEDQIGLVKAVAETGDFDEAIEIINALEKAAINKPGGKPGKPDWRLQLSKGQLLLSNERADEAKIIIEKAVAVYQSEPQDSTDVSGIALAKACYQAGMREEAQMLTDRIVRENHDREDIIDAVRSMYSALGMDGLGNDLIDQSRRVVVEINNRGVGLANAGKLDEAVELLAQASDELPGNLTIALNVLQVILAQIKSSGYTNQRQYLILEYLERAESINAEHPTLHKLRDKISKMQKTAQEQQSVA
jgi:tetratricopeptide (TPR) repeat protein